VAPHLTKRDREAGLRGVVKARLAAGWLPWVRPHPQGSGSEEVWARVVEDRVVVARPITPPEGEQVSRIMREGEG
jgi:hypothetical protein